ncbi:hypothetical protein PS6_003334 [Mucor atramentarius]
MIGLTTLVKILSISTSMVETEDPVVTKQRHQVSRSQTYARRYGIPVIDSFTGICNICRIKVLFLVLVISAFTALFWYTYIALWITWSCFYDRNSFMVNGFFDADLKQYEEINMNHIYYTSAAITIFITLVALISFVSITRLLIFHIKLGKYRFEETRKEEKRTHFYLTNIPQKKNLKLRYTAKMGITTIEYLNLPAYRNNNIDSESDSDDEEYDDADYDSDYYYSEAHAWKESAPKPHHQWAIYRLYRMVAHKVRRAWIVTMRAAIPNYRYRRLNKSKHHRACINCCSISLSTSTKPHLLPTTSHSSLKKQSRFKKKTHDSVNMEEFFATKTIRPVITLSEEEGEPDYNDDMGLDLAILDEEHQAKPKARPSSNKLARLLDMSEEDTLMRIQQEQQQLPANRVLDIPKEEEHALSEL